MGNVEISPSILAADLLHLGQEIQAIEHAGARSFHIDVMDGHFVPQITFGTSLIKALRRQTQCRLDVHLMVNDPESFIDETIACGADRVFIHQENVPHIYRLLQHIRQKGASPGVVLCPGTPAIMLKEILHLVDNVLIMTVNPGYGGQSLLKDQYLKIKEVKAMIDESASEANIAVDGGINEHTIADVAKAGGRLLIAGSAIFKQQNYAHAFEALYDKCHKT